MFLEIPQNSQENTCARVSFLIKLQAEACHFIKKETLAQVFPCEFCEISKNIFFTEHLWAPVSVIRDWYAPSCLSSFRILHPLFMAGRRRCVPYQKWSQHPFILQPKIYIPLSSSLIKLKCSGPPFCNFFKTYQVPPCSRRDCLPYYIIFFVILL